MTPPSIPHRRLHAQLISSPTAETPLEVVSRNGAVQGQEYLSALWAIGLRMRTAAEAGVEQAIADKTIARTWFMRGTLHFLAAADIRWMVALMAPRMRRLIDNVSSYNKLELDEALFARSNSILAGALQGGRQIMRPELAAALEQAGIPAEGLRLSLMLQRAQADGLICYGPRRGKQVTFVLLDEWLPLAPLLTHDDAVAEFARRYFTGHGPATVQDFAWWSGMPADEARAALEMVSTYLSSETIGGRTYWFSEARSTTIVASPTVYLLPAYDEYIVGYADRSAVLDPAHKDMLNSRENSILSNIVVIDGQVAGTWKRTLKKNAVFIETKLLAPLNSTEMEALSGAAERYGRFLGLPAVLSG